MNQKIPIGQGSPTLQGSPIYKRFGIDTGYNSEICQNIIDSCMKFDPINGEVNNGDVDTSIRRSVIRWVGSDPEINKMVTHYFHVANKMMFGFDIDQIFDVQFTEYHAGDLGYYNWHHDVDENSPYMYDRKLSFSMQLSDPDTYEGGLLEFEGNDEPMTKSVGNIAIFPSLKKHRVTPVTKGVRYSLVSWMEGPRWR